VDLASTGGTAGDATTAASFVYTAAMLGGFQLGTSLSPERPRKVGMMTAATMGTGYVDGDGTFVLAEAWETPATSEECT
jgi:hypothetical protein